MSGRDPIVGDERRTLRAGTVLDGEGAADARGAFLSVAGHELRQPLQTLGILNDILRRRAQGADFADLIERQAAALWSLRVMLDAVFDFGRAEAGSIRAEASEFPAGAVLTEVAQELAAESVRRGVRLDVVPSSARVRTDPLLLRRLIETLASYAMVYNGATRMVLGCRRRGAGVRLELWYAGAGVEAGSLAAILQGSSATSAGRNLKGLAVGLIAARAFAELLGAPLEACSAPGRGAMFAVTLRHAGESRIGTYDDAEGNGRRQAL